MLKEELNFILEGLRNTQNKKRSEGPNLKEGGWSTYQKTH